jgi:hypothetical protein
MAGGQRGSGSSGELPRVLWFLARLVGGQYFPYVIAGTMMLRVPGFALVSIGQVLSLLVIPAAMSLLRRRIVLALLALYCASALTGILLAMWSVRQLGLSIDLIQAAEVTLWPLSFMVGAVGFSWSMSRVGLRKVLGIFAVVGLLDFAIVVRIWSEFWKFGVGQFVVLLILVAMWNVRSRWISVAMVFPIVYSLATASRSIALLIVFALVTSLLIRRWRYVPRTRWRVEVGAVVVVSMGLLLLAPMAAKQGLFGSAIQLRMQENAAGGQSVIVGARSEWTGVVPLAKSLPLGFGPGIQPSTQQKQLVLERVATLKEGAPDYFRIHSS